MSVSSLIDDDSFSGSSMLTTIPNTSIADEPPFYTKGHSYGHVIRGWVPDFGGDHYPSLSSSTITNADILTQTISRCQHQFQKTPLTPFHDSSVYMMNYDIQQPKPVTAQTIILPNGTKMMPKNIKIKNTKLNHSPVPLQQKIAKFKTEMKEEIFDASLVIDDPTPAGFAVPTTAATSVASITSKKADNHVFSPIIVIHTLKANGMHHATYYRCSYRKTEWLKCYEKNFAEWVLPNMSPRIPVLHWCVQTGAVAAMNLRTGASGDEGLFVNLESESNQTETSTARWKGVANLSKISPYEQISGICRTESDSQVLTKVYQTDDELEYQHRIMRNFAPTINVMVPEASTSCSSFSDKSILQEESSSMCFIDDHNALLNPSANPKYAADYWLSLMTDNHPEQRATARRNVSEIVDSDSTSTAFSFQPLEPKNCNDPTNVDPSIIMNNVVDLCDYLLSTLALASKSPSTTSHINIQPSVASDEELTPVAASTSGTVTSFSLCVKRDPC